jgi:hypothetical protein
MGFIKVEDIDGVCLEGQIVCRICIEDEEWKEFSELEIILNTDEDYERLYFCDRCGERL